MLMFKKYMNIWLIERCINTHSKLDIQQAA